MRLRPIGRVRRGGFPAPERDKSPQSDESGQATVEFALCLPLILFLLIALVQVGLIAREQILLTHAAREAVRRMAVDDWGGASTDQVAAAAGLDAKRLVIRIHRPDKSSDKVMAQLSYRSPVRVVLVGRVLGEVRLSSQAAMRHEGRS